MFKIATPPNFGASETPSPVPSALSRPSYQPSGTRGPSMVPVKDSKSIADMQAQLSSFFASFNAASAKAAENKFFTFMTNKYLQEGYKVALKGFETPEIKALQHKADGKWDQATDNMLRAVMPVAYQMIMIAQKLKIELPFTDFERLQKLTPRSWEDTQSLSQTNKVVRAKRISVLVAKMRQSINDFVNAIIDASHQYTPNMLGKSFNLLSKDQKDVQLSSEEKQKADNLMMKEAPIRNVGIPENIQDPQSKVHSIGFRDINSIASFVSYLKTNNIKLGDQNAWEGENIKHMLNYLLEQVIPQINQIPSERK